MSTPSDNYATPGRTTTPCECPHPRPSVAIPAGVRCCELARCCCCAGRETTACPATYPHWPHAWPLVAGAMSGHRCDGVIPDTPVPCEAAKCGQTATAWHRDKSGVHWLACEVHRG